MLVYRVEPSAELPPPHLLTYTACLKVTFLFLSVFWQEPLLAPQSFSRLEEREGSEEERPGRLSAAGRMVSLSHGCGWGGDYNVYFML